MVTYLDIQRLSTEDGPGLRSTVFFKGCPLRCAWCHNPESLKFAPEVIRAEGRCIGCGLCAKVCGNGAQGAEIDRKACKGCLSCVGACPAGAMEAKGMQASETELCDELCLDKAYFGPDGGVTLSGGEALSQTEGAVKLLRLLKERGVHTAVDTCGEVPREALEKSLPYTDLYLFDIKLIDSGAHKALTGAGNERILENAKKLVESGASIWVRTPLIPGATDSEENIRAIGEFIKERMPDTERWELCAFNNLGRDKYRRLGLDYAYMETPLYTKREIENICKTARQAFHFAVCTGATRVE